MIFASDLDRTLVYSKFFVKADIKSVVAVESKDEKVISYMTETSLNILRKINDKIMFIPVTSRSLEQFRRLTVFQEELKTKYVVVANGGIILIDGEVDPIWEDKIKKAKSTHIEPEDLIERCKFFVEQEYVSSCRCCDNLFIYAVLKGELKDMESYEKLIDICKSYSYTVTKNNKKIYIIPEYMDKWAPIKYIMDLEKETELITAGDSMLDFPMLKNSKRAFIPMHGELFRVYKELVDQHKHMKFTTTEGIISSDELLAAIL